MFLLETLVNKKNILDILPKMRFDHFDYVEPVNHSGGLAVLWDNGIIHTSVFDGDGPMVHYHEPQGIPRGPRKRPKVKKKERDG